MDESGVYQAAARAVDKARPAIVDLIKDADAKGEPVFAAAITMAIKKRIPELWSTIQEYSLGDPYQTLMPFVERVIGETR